MKLIIFVFFLFLLTALASMLVFLNMQPVELILTPVYKGEYYHIPRMPLGLLVVLCVVFGFLLGYIFGTMLK